MVELSIMYLLMFAAAIRLRYKRADLVRPYKIPGKNYGMWIISGLGILSSLFALIIGFFPPSQIETTQLPFYVAFLLAGIVLGCLPPFIFTFMNPSK